MPISPFEYGVLQSYVGSGYHQVNDAAEKFREDIEAGKFSYDALHQKMVGLLDMVAQHLSAAHKAAISLWTSPPGYKLINDYLRGKNQSAKAESAVTALDEAIAASPLPQPVIAWRGVHGPHAEQIGTLGRDDVFFARGYTALTLDPRRATHYGGKDAILLAIHLPKGQPALYTSHPGINPGWTTERELLLPRGLRLQAIRREKIETPTWGYSGGVENAAKREFRVIHVEPMPPEWKGGLQIDTRCR